MNPWIVILLIMAGAVFAIDYIARRKAWKNNTKEEKVSLLINMFSAGCYVFLSALGMLWGITGGSCKTVVGAVLYEATLFMGSTFFVVAIAAVILSLVFRKKGKIKSSVWVNVFALLYIVAVLSVNYLADLLL